MSEPSPPKPTASTRPYLIRALHEWCTDNGLTPYVTVAVDNTVQVPPEYVNNGEIVLNVGFDATTALSLGNDYLSFKARFAGVVRDIMVPIDQVMAIFARENGQGMAFPRLDQQPSRTLEAVAVATDQDASPPADKSRATARPTLTRVK